MDASDKPRPKREKKLRQRARQGSGCVYRPKYKDESGAVREGRWRIKFTYTDPRTGAKKTINEIVPNATSATAAQDYLKRRMEETARGQKEHFPAVFGYEDLREMVLADYELNNRTSLETSRDGKTIGNIERLDDQFAGRAARDITTSDVEALKLKLRREGYANATVNRTLALLRRMFSLAVAARKLREDEVPGFAMLEEADARGGFVELDDFRRLRSELPEQARTLVTLGFYTGMRWGEIRKLRWADVDLDRAMLRLEPGRASRDVGARTRALPRSAARLRARRQHADH
jgi:integrase